MANGEATAIPSGEGRDLAASKEEYRYKLVWEGRLFLAYNKGRTHHGDFYRSKPDFGQLSRGKRPYACKIQSARMVSAPRHSTVVAVFHARQLGDHPPSGS